MIDERLEEAIVRTHAKLLILDPIQAYLGGGMDMNRANEARDMTKKLGALQRIYSGSADGISSEYPDLYRDHHSVDAFCDHISRLCLCQTKFPRKGPGIYPVFVPDDDSNRAGDHHQLCHHHESEAAQHLRGTGTAVGHFRVLHLFIERKF